MRLSGAIYNEFPPHGKRCMVTTDYGSGGHLKEPNQYGSGTAECELIGGRDAPASLICIIDSQSVKLKGKRGGWCLEVTLHVAKPPAGERHGDESSKSERRKRHIVVDVLGLILGCFAQVLQILPILRRLKYYCGV